MSETQEATTTESTTEQVADRQPPAGVDHESTARLLGWRPKEEFKGDPDKWVPASDFVERGLHNPGVMVERLNFLGDRFDRMDRRLGDVTKRYDDALSTIDQMANMLRTSEERAYKRARAELEARMDAAVEVGDKQAVREARRAMEELTPPPPPPQQPTQQAQQPAQPQPDPADMDFLSRNPWYHQDERLRNITDGMFMASQAKNPTWTRSQHLSQVERDLRAEFPHRFGQQTQQRDNPRRDDADAVMPASGTGATRQRRNARNFDTMPPDAKAAYEKYAALMSRKPEYKPLSKDEYARDYWSQFEEE